MGMIAAQNWEGWVQGPDLPHCPGQQPSVEDALTSLAHWVVVRVGERVIRDGQCLRPRMAPEDKNEVSREVNPARPGSPYCAPAPPLSPCSYTVFFITIIIIIIIIIHNSERIKTSKDVVFPSTYLVTFYSTP